MYDPTNPYASPGAEIHPVAAQWLGTPSLSLQRVANGLGLIFAGNILSLLAVAGLFGGGIAFAGDAATEAAIANVFSVAMLVSFGLNVAGSLFCLATPAESGAQVVIYTSVGATILGLLIQLGSWFGAFKENPSTLVNLLNIVAGITFLIFLRLLSRFIGRYDLGRRAMSILVWSIISTVVAIAGMIMLVAALGLALLRALAEQQPQAEAQLKAVLQAGAGGALLAMLLLAIAAIVAFVTLIRYIILLAHARSAILTASSG